MASGNSVGNIIGKVFDEFKKVTPALIAILIVSGLLLFLPETVLSRMDLNNLPELWKRIIGIAFLISATLIITFTTDIIIKNIDKIRKRRKFRKCYMRLSDDHKAILSNILRSSNKRMKLDYTAGTTQYLMSSGFIIQVQTYLFVGPEGIDPSDFIPHPWLIDLYNTEPKIFK